MMHISAMCWTVLLLATQANPGPISTASQGQECSSGATPRSISMASRRLTGAEQEALTYSKWDHLPEYSSSSGDIGHEGEEDDNDESDDAEVACDYFDAKEDELDGDDSWDQEGETRTSGNGACEEGADEKTEKCQTTIHEMQEGGHARDSVMEMVFTDNGADNKRLLLEAFQSAGEEIHRKFTEASLEFTRLGANPHVFTKLDEHGQMQINAYTSHLRGVDAKNELVEGSATQLKVLLQKWRDDQIEHIQDVAEGLASPD